MSTFTNRTLVVSSGGRGIGLAIALGTAKHGANVVLLGKTAEPHPKLPGTVYTAVADVEAAGGKGVAVVGDVREEEHVQRAVDTAVEHFGGVDTVINNASAIATEPTEQLAAKKFDLMMDINVRGTFLLTKAAMPHLRKSSERTRGAQRASAHVVTLAPPMNMNPHWLGAHPSYTLSKYGLTLLSLGWAAEYADAAVEILSRPPADVNGKCFIDSAVLAEAGVTDLSGYGGGDDPILDIFVDKP
jgi:citronellol/citronellal dehydrogenase